MAQPDMQETEEMQFQPNSTRHLVWAWTCKALSISQTLTITGYANSQTAKLVFTPATGLEGSAEIPDSRLSRNSTRRVEWSWIHGLEFCTLPTSTTTRSAS